ncbi:MAG TPA: type I secretion system permease/ATPase, partial [Alphaproteobacteria bacterium]
MEKIRRPMLRVLVAIGAFSFFVHLLVLAVPLYSLQVYDRILSSRSEETLVWLTLITVLAIATLAAIDGLRSRILVRLSGWLERQLAAPLLGLNFRSRLAASGQQTSDDARGLEDLASLRQFLTGPGAISLFDAPWMPLYLAVIYLLHPALGMIAAGGAVLLFATGVVNELATRRPLTEANVAHGDALSRVRSFLLGADVVRALGMVHAVMRRWQREEERVLRLQARASDRAGAIQSFAKFSRLFIQIAIVGVGAWLAIEREITPGILIAGAIIVSRALAPAESLIGSWRSVIGAQTAYRRIARRLGQKGAPGPAVQLPAPQGRIDIENVSLLVPGVDRAILQNIRFSLQPGESLGIIGPSAAGKSTLARVILGLVPPSTGTVRIDGSDINTWDRDRLGRYVGYVPQESRLFHGTIAENIARLGDLDDEQVIAAARFAGAHEMILRLPRGYDTPVEPNGPSLSGGQRQLVALARAFYGAPRLVVLDEPNSNLDRDGETALLQTLERAREAGITTIVVAHRTNVLTKLDKLMILRDGRVVMFGPRAEVLAGTAP